MLARQRETLQLLIAELRQLLDDDDNWRALAALESVGEAAGGVSSDTWAARQQELKAALAANPVYRLCNELERALVVALSMTSIDDEALVAAAAASIIAKSVQPEPKASTSELAHEMSTPANIPVAEPRRESIAARIAPLAMPSLIVRQGHDADEPSLVQQAAEDSGFGDVQEFPPASGTLAESEPPPVPDTVAVVAQSIVAGLAKVAIAEPDVASEPVTPLRHESETAHRPEAVTGAIGDSAELTGKDVPDATESVPIQAGSADDDCPSESATGPSRTHEDLTDDVPLELVANDGGEEDSEFLDFDSQDFDDKDLDDQDFEAEVSIVTRAVPVVPAVTPIADAAEDLDDDGDRESETLEQRLQRLDHQSEGLLRKPPATGDGQVGEEDDLRANKWLEMIRARRASFARNPGIPSFSQFVSAQAPPQVFEAESDSELVEIPPEQTLIGPPDTIYGLGGLDSAEAEVKIVQRKPANPASSSSAPSPPVYANKAPRPPRPLPAQREQAIEAIPFAGSVEEASVEIVRHSGRSKERT